MIFRPLAFVLVAIGGINVCAKPDTATLGSADPCADAKEPSFDLFAGTGSSYENAIEDFTVDGESVYFSARPDRDVLENVLYRVSIVDAVRAPATEIARVRRANRIATTPTHLYYEEVTSNQRETRLLFRMPKSGGTPSRVSSPSEEAPDFLETGLAADQAGNLVALRTFGGFAGLLHVPPSGPTVRIEMSPAIELGPWVLDRGEVFVIARERVSGPAVPSFSVLAFSLARPNTPRTLYGPARPAPGEGVVDIGVDDKNVYVSKDGSFVVVPKDGGPHSSLAIEDGARPFGVAVAGGFVYADFQNEARTLMGLGRVPIGGGAIESVSKEQPRKIVAAGCYVVWSAHSGLHARRR